MSNIGEVLFLSSIDVATVLDPSECLARCEETFRWVGEGKVDQVNPVDLWLSPPDGPYGYGRVQAFPSHIKPIGIAGVKWLGVFKHNKRRGLPTIGAIDIISDAETAMPLAIIDGTSVTAMRTGGHAGVGAKYLARKDSGIVAIIGCGVEGRSHLTIMNLLFNIDEVRACDIIEDARLKFVKEMSDKLGLRVTAVESAEEATKNADIVCMVTTSEQPVVQESWLAPGCHVCATVGFRDLDPACAEKFDKWVVGWSGRDLEWIEGPEAGKIVPKHPSVVKENIYADLSTEIITGRKSGRQSENERTIMTHMGMPAFDAAVAALVYEKASALGVGMRLKVF
ncbi:ornithine cyclodeaminase family protein [Chloroflexota bacterium]